MFISLFVHVCIWCPFPIFLSCHSIFYHCARALAIQAADMGGGPWLVSFAGMAEVLGWARRPPLVAPCNRPRVLDSWAPLCGGRAPAQHLLPFAAVRGMSPEEFVDLLARDLQAFLLLVGVSIFRAGIFVSLEESVEPPMHNLQMTYLYSLRIWW